ncbi:hypothetical protein BDV96DRAFT_517779 [Lophiotrema nucula]|uniref:BTB domain-containing protein n=1 Tax=Lophiotrema nucula TaxID=690887 RepID=A0A6A5ZFG1_9PLEO|nr:hypothetical protein BDV96DRAFT_517779 [Lophiotrema nucula]
MADIVHKIDLNPDTVIILEDPTVDFAVWDTGDDTLARTSTGSFNGDAASSETTLEPQKNDNTSQELTENEAQSHSVQYLVSSRHLMLASPWFQRALTREGWTESDRDADGRYCIRTSGWDSNALLILLNILHLRNRRVPRLLSLETLAKIAVLVDYYECAEAVDLFGDVWTNAYEETPVPTSLCRDLVLWLWVSWSFQLTEKFEQATFVAIKHSIGDFDTLDLPLPAAVTEAIEKARQEGMLKLQSGLAALLGEYRSKQYSCPVGSGTSSFECGSMMYGALIKGMDTVGISTEGDSFDGISLEELCNDIRRIRSPTWYYSGSSGYYQSQHMCKLTRPLKDMTDEVEKSLKGLKLEKLKKDI